MSEKIAELIGKYVGQYVKTDPNNFSGGRKSFMRIRVLIDVRMPLKRKMKIRKGNSDDIWVDFRYERLPTFCFFCGIIGHSDRACETYFELRNQNVEKMYGVWLKASNRRMNYGGGEQWLLDGPAPAIGGPVEVMQVDKHGVNSAGRSSSAAVHTTQSVGGRQATGKDKNVISPNVIGQSTLQNLNPNNLAPDQGKSNQLDMVGEEASFQNSKTGAVLMDVVGHENELDPIVVSDAKRRRHENGSEVHSGRNEDKVNVPIDQIRQGSQNSVEAGLDAQARRAL